MATPEQVGTPRFRREPAEEAKPTSDGARPQQAPAEASPSEVPPSTVPPPSKAPPGKAPPGKAPPGKAPPGKGAPPGKAQPGKAPPGKARPGKAPPGKAPPGKAPPSKAAARSPHVGGAGTGSRGSMGDEAPPQQLPIGRRLGLRPKQIDAEAFRGLLDTSSGTGGATTPTAGAPPAQRSTTAELVAAAVAAGDEEAQARRSGSRPSFDATAVNLAALRDAFAPQPRPRRESQRRAPGVELLPLSTAQNIAIVLAKLRIDTGKLASALAQLEPAACVITPEEAARLLDVWPAAEVLQPIDDYVRAGSDPSRLRDIERQVLPLVELPRMGPRLRLMNLAGTLDERVEEALMQLQRVQDVCAQIQASTILRDLLAVVLVLFNYVNFGMEAGEATTLRGVDVHSLLRLSETKAYKGDFPGFHMLHFVVKQLLEQRPELRAQQLEQELQALPWAAQVSLDRLRQDLAQLRGDHAFVLAELRDHRKDYEEPPPQTAVAAPTPSPPSPETPPEPALPAPPVAPPLPPPALEPPQVPQSPPSPPATPPPPRREPVQFVIHEREAQTPRVPEPTPRRPPVEVRKGALETFLGHSLDLKSFAEAWMNGDAVLGKPEVPATTVYSSFKLVVPDDADPPPPGWLWLYTSAGKWQKCWCEIRATVVMIIKKKGRKCLGTVYVSLHGAQIAPLGSLYATNTARELAETAAHGFEIQNENGRQNVRLCASRRREADRWIRTLDERARLPGVGFLWARQDSHPVSMGIDRWRRYYCCLESGSILGFERPRDGIEGKPPKHRWSVIDGTVRQLPDIVLQGDDFKTGLPPAVQAAEKAHGFALEVGPASWLFVCDTHNEQRGWEKVIVASQPRPPVPATRGSVYEGLSESQVDKEQLFDLFAPGSFPSDGTPISFGEEAPSGSPGASQVAGQQSSGSLDEAGGGTARPQPNPGGLPSASTEDQPSPQDRTVEELRRQLVLAVPPQRQRLPSRARGSSDWSRSTIGSFSSIDGGTLAVPPPSRAMSESASFSSLRDSVAAVASAPSSFGAPPLSPVPTAGQTSGPVGKAGAAWDSDEDREAAAEASAAAQAKEQQGPPKAGQEERDGVHVAGEGRGEDEEARGREEAAPKAVREEVRKTGVSPSNGGGTGATAVPAAAMRSCCGTGSAGSGDSDSGGLEEDEDDDEDISGGLKEEDDDEDEEEQQGGEKGCVARLERLDNKLLVHIEAWAQALSQAEESCRDLLIFFGLEAPPSGPRLSVIAQQLLESVAEWVRQLRRAWDDLDRHCPKPLEPPMEANPQASYTSGARNASASVPISRPPPQPRVAGREQASTARDSGDAR